MVTPALSADVTIVCHNNHVAGCRADDRGGALRQIRRGYGSVSLSIVKVTSPVVFLIGLVAYPVLLVLAYRDLKFRGQPDRATACVVALLLFLPLGLLLWV